MFHKVNSFHLFIVHSPECVANLQTGGHPAAILVALGFSLALAGVCACGLGIMNIYQYLWKNHYRRSILEKDALLSPVLNLSEGETPFREYFRKVNCWPEKGIDDIILRYVH